MIGIWYLVIGTAIAAPLTGGTYTIPSLTISSGGSNNLSGGTYKMIDIKGQAVIGSSIGGTYGLGLGGIYGEVVAATGEVVVIPTTPIEGMVLNEGPVILNIVRESETAGSAIKITWKINTTEFPAYLADNPVDIYYLTGSGSGEYTVNAGYVKVVNSNAFVPGALTGSVSVPLKEVTINDQVGRGSPELYFKGLIAGSAPTVTGDYGLAGAVAAGKINMDLNGTTSTQGKNFLSVPFLITPESTLAIALGDGSDAPWTNGDLVQFKFRPSPAYQTAEYKDGVWKDSANTANPPPFGMEPNKGYVFVVKAPKVLCAVGKVINTNVAHEIYAKGGEVSGGKTNLGLIYPVQIGLTTTSLISDGAANGDLIQYKTSAIGEAYISANVTGGVWVNDANPSDPIDPRIATLKVPNSYVFVRYGDTGLVWNRTAP